MKKYMFVLSIFLFLIFTSPAFAFHDYLSTTIATEDEMKANFVGDEIASAELSPTYWPCTWFPGLWWLPMIGPCGVPPTWCSPNQNLTFGYGLIDANGVQRMGMMGFHNTQCAQANETGHWNDNWNMYASWKINSTVFTKENTGIAEEVVFEYTYNFIQSGYEKNIWAQIDPQGFAYCYARILTYPDNRVVASKTLGAAVYNLQGIWRTDSVFGRLTEDEDQFYTQIFCDYLNMHDDQTNGTVTSYWNATKGDYDHWNQSLVIDEWHVFSFDDEINNMVGDLYDDTSGYMQRWCRNNSYDTDKSRGRLLLGPTHPKPSGIGGGVGYTCAIYQEANIVTARRVGLAVQSTPCGGASCSWPYYKDLENSEHYVYVGHDIVLDVNCEGCPCHNKQVAVIRFFRQEANRAVISTTTASHDYNDYYSARIHPNIAGSAFYFNESIYLHPYREVTYLNDWIGNDKFKVCVRYYVWSGIDLSCHQTMSPCTGWLDFFNWTVPEGYACFNNKEQYTDQYGNVTIIKDCGPCGCSDDGITCRPGVDMWYCDGNLRKHQNSTCQVIGYQICKWGCNSTLGECNPNPETGEEQIPCNATADCTPYCINNTRFYNGYCDVDNECDYASEFCQYGCDPLTGLCAGMPAPEQVVNWCETYMGFSDADCKFFLAIIITLIISTIIAFYLAMHGGGTEGAGIAFGISFLALLIMWTSIGWIDPIVMILLMVFAGAIVVWSMMRIFGG